MNASDLEYFLQFTRNSSETDSQQMCSGLWYSNFYLNYAFIHTVKTYACKSLLPRFKTTLPEVISPVDPLPKRCFYEKHVKNLKLWKNTLPAFVDRRKLQTGMHYIDQPYTTRDQHMSFAD